jgi:TatD DNase family protein
VQKQNNLKRGIFLHIFIMRCMWIDTHCHLSAPEFAEDREAVWLLARNAGVKKALLPSIDLCDCEAVVDLAMQMPGCTFAFGIHPLFVTTTEGAVLEALTAWLEKKPPVAIGEIGLDGINKENWERQERFFLAQLKLARKYDLPVILHVRRAVDAVLRGLKQVRVRGGIAHAFNGSAEEARAFLKAGFKIGFGGSLTYLGSRRIRSLATELPLDAIVLETDAPDIPPSWLSRAGKKPRNTPAELPKIGKALADLRGMTVETLAYQTSANAYAALPGIAISTGKNQDAEVRNLEYHSNMGRFS